MRAGYAPYLEWLERHRLDFSELESVKLLRRVFGEQLKRWNKSLRLRASGHRGRCAIRTIPMPIMQRSGKSSGWATRYTWWRVWNQRSPPRKRRTDGEFYYREYSRWRRPKTRSAGWASSLKDQQQHHELEPITMYADAGYVTESTLVQAEQNGMELLGPCRPDPHKGPYKCPMLFMSMSTSARPFVRRETSAQCSASQTLTWERSTIALSGRVNVTVVRSKSSVPAPRRGADF